MSMIYLAARTFSVPTQISIDIGYYRRCSAGAMTVTPDQVSYLGAHYNQINQNYTATNTDADVGKERNADK